MAEQKELQKAVRKVDEKEIKKRKKKRKRHRRHVMIIRFFCKIIPLLVIGIICGLIIYYTRDYYYIEEKYDIQNALLYCALPCGVVTLILGLLATKWYKWMMKNEIW